MNVNYNLYKLIKRLLTFILNFGVVKLVLVEAELLKIKDKDQKIADKYKVIGK
jgi:hypothetical protein